MLQLAPVTVLTAHRIRTIVAEMGQRITHHYYQNLLEDLVVIGLLKGSFIFMADLIREIHVPLVTDFLTVSSYREGTTSCELHIIKDIDVLISNKDVLLVEDIVDSGNTINAVIKMMQSRNPRSLKVCSFLSKPSRRVVDVSVDFLGITIEDNFVVGYGLDYNEKYRELPYLGMLVSSE